MRTMPKLIKDAIWSQYAPRQDGDILQSCLYVGPLLDGWKEFMPEAARLVVRGDDDNPLTIRHRLKRFAMDIVNPVTKRRDTAGRGEDVAGYGAARVEFKRGSHPWVVLDRTTVQQAEPGELINSVIVREDPETGEASLVSPTLRGEEPTSVIPRIRVDHRHNLHYLLAGDQFKFTYMARRRVRVMEFRLRPRAEGSSLVTADGGSSE